MSDDSDKNSGVWGEHGLEIMMGSLFGVMCITLWFIARRDRFNGRNWDQPSMIFGTEYRGFSYSSLICLCIPQFCTTMDREEIPLTTDREFCRWMAVAHPEVVRYRKRENYCCIWFCIPMCLPCQNTIDDPEPAISKYQEEYKLHLEYKPGSEKMIEAQKDFEILMEEGGLE